MKFSRLLGAAALLCETVSAIELNIDDEQSIRDAASTLAYGMISRYTGNLTGDVPGNLPDPYHWWTTGAMFGALIDYWWMTGDETYINTTMQALLHQAAPSRDFMPENQTLTLGNDDQGFWAMAAMSAAENNFPNPEEDQPQWLALAQACFNQWVARWHKAEAVCNGGLRWQIFEFNKGFDYKNSISNGCFFNVAARLARYTGNSTYAEWAAKVWDWQESTGLISSEFAIFDGVHEKPVGEPCPTTDFNRWSYNAGIFLVGAAFMANVTDDPIWLNRTEGLLTAAEKHFFKDDGILVEQRCEPFGHCNIDQRTFKGYLVRWMASTATVVPSLFDRIMDMLRPNAVAAAATCTGQVDGEWRGLPNTACGLKWNAPWDGSWGVGEQMNAMSIVMYMLSDRPGQGPRTPVTNATGGTSRGDPNAGGDSHSWEMTAITTGDRAGAGILTSLICLGVVSGVYFLMYD